MPAAAHRFAWKKTKNALHRHAHAAKWKYVIWYETGGIRHDEFRAKRSLTSVVSTEELQLTWELRDAKANHPRRKFRPRRLGREQKTESGMARRSERPFTPTLHPF